MMQDCTRIRSLQGSQTLLNWENGTMNSEEVKEEKLEETTEESTREESSNSQIPLDSINKDTYLKDLIKVYPNLKKDMIKISERFKILQGPLAAVMLPKATLEKVSEKGDIDLDTLIEKIKELIKTY